MSDPQCGGSGFKKRGQISPGIGKSVGKFKAVIRLYTLHRNAFKGKPRGRLLQEIYGRIGALLLVSTQITQARGITFTSICTRSPG
ncbi:MAG: hypothetical protein RR352_07510, partial [Clostridia bacterium]